MRIGQARSRSRPIPARIGGGLGFVDADEDPARRPIHRHEQIAPGRFISHLRQILEVDLQVARLTGLERLERLERLVLGPGRFGLQIAQIADPFAIVLEPMALNGSPAQTPVEAGARHLRVEELPHHGEQVVERHQQRLAQHDRRLRRGQWGLQPVRRGAAVMHRVAVPPLADGLRGRPEPRRQHRAGSALAWIAARIFGVVMAWL